MSNFSSKLGFTNIGRQALAIFKRTFDCWFLLSVFYYPRFESWPRLAHKCFVHKTGVRQGCLLLHFSVLTSNWLDARNYSQQEERHTVDHDSLLDNLDFADDPALLFHTYKQTDAEEDVCTGHHSPASVTKVVGMITASTNPISLRGEPIEDVDSFTYLGSVVSKTGGTDEECKGKNTESAQGIPNDEEYL